MEVERAKSVRTIKHPHFSLTALARVAVPALAGWLAFIISSGDARASIELKTIASGFSAPLYITAAGDGRLFIVEQGGRIRILSDGTLLETPFLDIADRVVVGVEAGLLGLAFHPNYQINGRFFVNYVRDGPNGLETVVAEYAVSPEDANLALKASEKIVLRFQQDTDHHNGGMLEFGPDGFLYIGTGDGGIHQDHLGRAQDLGTLLGKILRIDVDSDTPYAVPPDNPFVGAPGRDEIWAYGLRNPWRFSFDRLTGRLIAGDVGRTSREEVDLIVRGGNYGWNIMEGTLCFQPATNCSTDGLILPIHEYDHDPECSITGGYVYRGTAIPSLWGKYVFADFCSGRLWTLTEVSPGQWQREPLLDTGFLVSSLGEDETGELYVVRYKFLVSPPDGTVHKIVRTDLPQPAVNEGGVVSAASFLPGPVAPGEIVSIFGLGIGPDQGAAARLDPSGRVDSFLADTLVLFDGIQAPLFYVQANQTNAQVPYAVAGKTSTVMQVVYKGARTDPVTLSVADTAPAIFALAGGTGPGVIFNQNLTLNSASNPAPRGSFMVLYATGEGQTVPAGMDGTLAQAPSPEPLFPVSLTIGGFPADIVFAGSAPGFAGLLQVNAQVPMEVTPGSAVPVSLTIGNASSQPGITMAVESYR